MANSDQLRKKRGALRTGVTDERNLEHEVEIGQDYSARDRLQERQQPTRTHAQASVCGSSKLDLPNSVDAMDQVRQQRQSPIVLLRIQIPTFDANLREWQAFWDYYDATIHQNNDLPRIKKLKYLLTYLTGSDMRSIKGIRLAKQNYDLAIKTLTDQFGRRDLLINEDVYHLSALIPAKSSSDVPKLCTLPDNGQFRLSPLEGIVV
ncbi:hypothetical protein HPB52_022980 [Rhipicephalus sanguineus]|uniref:Uncharacterized protein n=1 Tax=Rhipicephalus sanguineus TaxID=34632 RepID=A0A9D4PQ30_RHISA|nr:hypothetical protein HPB52_022980 [Rhipicephalus sanguineus]